MGSWAAIGRTGDFWTALPEIFVGASTGAAVPVAPARAGDVTVSSLDFAEMCATCATVQDGSRVLSTGGVSLLGSVRRGDRIIVGGETLVVSSSGAFTNESIPLSSAFRGASGSGLPVYIGGEQTGSHSVSFLPTVRGVYEVKVSAPRTAQVQRVRTVLSSDGSGSFVLAYPGGDGTLYTTSAIPFNATAGELQAAIIAAVPLFRGASTNVTVAAVSSATIAEAANEEERAAAADNMASAPLSALSVAGSNNSAFADEFGGRAWDVSIVTATDAGLDDLEKLLFDDSELEGGSLLVSVISSGAPS